MTPDTESSTAELPDDDGLEWLREIRHQMAAEANYDPYEMGRRLRAREQASGRQFYRTERALVPVEATYSTDEVVEPSCVLREVPPAK